MAPHANNTSTCANTTTDAHMHIEEAQIEIPLVATQETPIALPVWNGEDAKKKSETQVLPEADFETVCITDKSPAKAEEEEVPPYHARGWRVKFWQHKFYYLDTERFVTSHILPAWGLLCVRLVLVCYALATITTSGVLNFNHGLWLRFFTQLSYIGLTIYLMAAVVHTGLYVRQGGEGRPRSFEAQPRWLNLAYWILYEVLFTYKVIVPVVFWTCLSSGAPAWSEHLQAWDNLSVHGMDFVVMFIEFSCNRQIFVFGHITFFIAVMAVYCVYTWIFYFAGFGWTYWFMDITTPAAAYWYPALIIAFCLVWTACFFVHVAKEKAVAKFKNNN